MKIIDIGICVDNNDPKGLGRIRYKPFGTLKSVIERYIDYEDWDENDPLIAIPFLPLHINVVPQVRQSIKLLRYDTDKTTQNTEYIAGPFSTPHDFGSETFTGQHKNTTYGGVIVKDLPDVRDKNGKYIDKKSESTLLKPEDNGLNGNYGSDLIFTENGLVLRGGKLLPKETKNKRNRRRLQEVPLLSDKMARLTLKKFPNKMVYKDDDSVELELVVSKIKYIIEYEIDNLESPTELKLFIYRLLKTRGNKYNTNKFNNTTKTDFTDTKTYKLINEDDSTTTPTTTISVDSIDSACSELRSILSLINYKSLFEVSTLFPKEDIHPCYFRPTENLKLLNPTTESEVINKDTLLSCYKISSIKGSGGLIYSQESATAPYKEKPIKRRRLKKDKNSEEQSFSSLSSDLLYFLSTNTSKGKNLVINFNELDQYELTQEDYLEKIHPNTYSLVRGEELVKLIDLMYKFMRGHVHNINDVGLYHPETERELQELIETMKTNLINRSIRIN